MLIINFIVKCFCFFGTILKVSLEQLVCRSRRILVEDVSCFSLGTHCGHILHELPTNKKDAQAICTHPFVLNFILGLLFLMPSAKSIFFLEYFNFINLILFWFGISLWTNLFPSIPDSLNFHHFAYDYDEKSSGRTRFLSSVMSFGAKLESTGLTLITSLAAAFLLAQFSRFILPYFYDMVQELYAMMSSFA